MASYVMIFVKNERKLCKKQGAQTATIKSVYGIDQTA